MEHEQGRCRYQIESHSMSAAGLHGLQYSLNSMILQVLPEGLRIYMRLEVADTMLIKGIAGLA